MNIADKLGNETVKNDMWKIREDTLLGRIKKLSIRLNDRTLTAKTVLEVNDNVLNCSVKIDKNYCMEKCLINSLNFTKLIQ